MSRHRQLSLTLMLALCGAGHVLAQSNPPPQKKIYCWDENGHKVCGDALPAAAAERARTEISIKSGLPTAHVERALTEEERSAAQQAAEAARRQAEAEAMQKRRDLAMVESYMTEADLRRAYGERTALLDESIKTSQLSITTLHASLLSLLKQAGDQELSGTPVARQTTETIRAQHAELLRQRQLLQAQQADRAALESELADSIRRYREMKGNTAQTAGTATAPTPSP
ncbi:hypothetical protein [Thermomonas hydrothermalis]|uniref:DUF4124 domain-containing protein n=1 Tax=Thermomonas hydrothermalis TaxID=213588 RepID=A0A1M4WZD7_9GAMM|nr:hypothetical protein [Thermomonas hydrothermalis]SHE86560.1 hypothetical protein SAMN02745204_01293 [Thermomonas hydrothermalis]